MVGSYLSIKRNRPSLCNIISNALKFIFDFPHFIVGLISKRSISIQNDGETHMDWFKDFMRQSLDTIRDTVVQACITAISARPLIPLNSNMNTQDININNHLTRLVQSEHSLTSHKTIDSWPNHQFRIPSVKQQNNDDEIGKKQRIHQRARTSHYPMYKNVLRTPVSDIRVPWSYEWPQYKPTIFTAEEIYISPGADPGIKATTKRALEKNVLIFRSTKITIIDISSF
jgi:hypothetical protein